jgi:hypothetical protein
MPIPKPNKGENQNDYVGRCMHEIASEYDTNEQAVAICINTYDKGSMSKDTMSRVQLRINGIRMIELASDADKIKTELAQEGGGAYPWDECIADQTARYGDEETANKVCGYIKSEYGS